MKKTILLDTWKRAGEHKNTVLLTMGFDVLFIASMFLLNFLLNMFFPNPQDSLMNAGPKTVFLLLVMLVYAATVFLSYSFFKLLIINKVKTLFEKSKMHLDTFSSLLLLNFLIVCIYLGVFAVFSAAFVFTISVDILAAVRDVFLVVFVTFFYLTINTAHSLFAQKKLKVRKIISMTFDIIFNSLKDYFILVLFTVITFFVLAAAYYAFDWLVLLIFGSLLQNQFFYIGYVVVNTLVIASLGLVLLAFNRVFFYNLVRQHSR